jgi:hypothetical protein
VGQDDAVAGHEELPLTGEEVVTIVGEVRAEGLSNAPWTPRQSVVEEGNLPWLLFSAETRVLCAFDDVPSSNQTAVRLAQLPDDDVDRVMQTVRKIAVEVTWWTEQSLVSVGHAPIRVCPGIPFASVRFDLSDPDGNRRIGIGALEYAAEQGWGDLEYVASKETTARVAQPVKVAHREIVLVTLGHSIQLEVVLATPENWKVGTLSRRRVTHIPSFQIAVRTSEVDRGASLST